MRYATKVVALLLLVSVAPVLASGLISATLSTDAVEEQTHQLQRGLAIQTAAHVNSWFSRVVSDMRRATSYLPFDQTQGGELAELLRVPFRQLEYVSVIALIDQRGKAMVPPVYLPAELGRIPDDLRGRPRLAERDLRQVSQHVPLSAALKHGVAIGPSYRNSAGDSRVVCAARIDSFSPPAVLAAEVTLDPVLEILLMDGKLRGRSYLLDTSGKVVVSSDKRRVGASLASVLKGISSGRYHGADGDLLGSTSRVELLGWTVLLEQPLAEALASAQDLREHTMLWTILCVVLALAGGVYLGRGVTRPVKELAAAAGRIQEGDLGVEVKARGRDELARLASAFNEMAVAVRRQQQELERWNEELQQRVEEKTREVHDALEQVIRSQKLGALGELGAGFAHELNNPLAGIMGLCQLLQIELPPTGETRQLVDQIIDQIKRIGEIAKNLQRFCETPEGVEHQPVEVQGFCQGAISLADAAIEAAGIEVEISMEDDLPRIQGNADELRQVILHLVHNAVRAMPEGGRLSIRARKVEGAVRILVTDTGKGISKEELSRIFEPFYAADKTKTHHPGLGLAVVNRIVSEHHGQITVRSSPGETEFAISLPGLREELHLKR